MKKIIVFFAAIIYLMACSENTNTTKMSQTYRSDTLHFSMQYSTDFEVLQNPKDGNSIAFVRKQTEGKNLFQENMVCWTEEMPMAISDSIYLQASITQLKISNPALNIFKNQAVKLGDNTFSSFSFDYTAKNNTQFSVRGYCIVKGQRGYNFSCTAIKVEMPEKIKIFEQMLSTFKPI